MLISIKRCLPHWWEASVHGVKASWFGWAGAAGSVAVALLFDSASQIQQVFINITSAFLAVLLFNMLLLAPWRAWKMLNPFTVHIESGYVASQYPKTANEPQRLCVIVKNNSYKRRDNCVLHVMEVNSFDNQNQAFPRLIEEFTIGSGDRRIISLLMWTSRENYDDDLALSFCGPVSWGWGGNYVQLPVNDQHRMKIRISTYEADACLFECDVWVVERQLKCRKLD